MAAISITVSQNLEAKLLLHKEHKEFNKIYMGGHVEQKRVSRKSIKGHRNYYIKPHSYSHHVAYHFYLYIMPEYTRTHLVDLDSDEADMAAMLLNEKDTARFNFFGAIKRRGVVGPLTRQRSTQQHEYTHFVRTLKDWDDVEEVITNEVETFRFICLDTESYLPNHRKLKNTAVHKQLRQDQERVLYILIGTLQGRAVVFDLEELYGGYYPQSVNPSRMLPDVVKKWLWQDDIIVAGSDVADDIKKLGLEAQKVVDTAYVFSRAMTPVGDTPALIDIGQTRACGLGVQSYYSRGEDYKPMTASKYISRYGNYGHQHLARHWPESRDYKKIYKWTKNALGEVTEAQKFYLYMDATAGASLVASLVVESYVNRRLELQEDAPISAVVELILGPEFKSVVAELEGPSHQEEVEPRNTPQKRAGNQDDEAGPSHKIARTNKDFATQTEDDVEVVAYIGMDIKKCLPGTNFPYFDAEMREMNYYKADPVLPRSCLYCGSASHSMYTKEKTLLCPRKDEELENRVRCRYVGCNDRTTHHTIVCKALHRRCDKCHHRGHGDDDGCEYWDERDWEQAKERFERAAGDGLWTRTRKWEPRYGFYCHVMGTEYPFRKTYSERKDMGVWAADRLVGIRNRDNVIMYGRISARSTTTSNRHGGRSQGQRRSYWR